MAWREEERIEIKDTNRTGGSVIYYPGMHISYESAFRTAYMKRCVFTLKGITDPTGEIRLRKGQVWASLPAILPSKSLSLACAELNYRNQAKQRCATWSKVGESWFYTAHQCEGVDQ